MHITVLLSLTATQLHGATAAAIGNSVLHLDGAVGAGAEGAADLHGAGLHHRHLQLGSNQDFTSSCNFHEGWL